MSSLAGTRPALLLNLVIGHALVGLGCHPLDRVAQSIEAYGTISVSAPMLVPVERAKGFDFDLDKSAEFYFSADRVEGAVRLIRQESFDVQIALKVRVEQLISTLGEMRAAASPAASETIRRKLTKQALVLAALEQAGAGAAGADAITQNPFLQAGLGFLLESLGGATTGAGESPDKAPDEAAPPKTVEEALAEGGPQPEPPTVAGGAGSEPEPEFKSMLPLSRPAKEVLTSEKFLEPLERYSDKITISPRQALMLAANDKMTQDLFKWFAEPTGFGKNKQAYFCMLTVSCHPGYWTRKNFSADVLVTTEYARTGGRAAGIRGAGAGRSAIYEYSSEVDLPPVGPPPNNEKQNDFPRFAENFRRPTVAAVYPMVDSQVLDLRQSLREQVSSAVQLAVLGFGAQAEALIDYVERIEQDAETRTVLTVGSAYSSGGYNFGFRVQPRFVALEHPDRKRSGPGSIMEATEFPAMVLLLVDKSDISPDCGGESENGFDHVVFHAESRWLARDWWTALWWRQSERKMLKRARRLDQTGANLQMGQRSITSPNLFQEPMRELEYMTLRRRRGALAASGLGSTIVTQLPKFPPPNEPTIDGVVLSAGKTVTSQHFYGWKNAVSVFVVKGNNFSDETVKGATVGSRDCAVKVIGSKTVVVTCDAWGDKTETEAVPQSGEPEPYDKTKYEGKPSIAELVLITTYGPKKVGKVQFDYKYGASRTNARPSVAIERDKDGNITRVKVTGEFEDAEKLLKLIQDALLCCDEHAHHVCGVCGCVYHKGGDCCCKSSRSGRAKVPG